MKSKFLLFSVAFILSFCLGLPVLAQGLRSAGSVVGGIAGQAGADTYTDPQDLVGTVLNAALTLVGLIFLVLMVYAGYLWLTARGEEEPITKAKKIIVSSIIGFVLVASAYSITVFIGKRLETGGGGGGGGGGGAESECTKNNPGWGCVDIDQCLGSSQEVIDKYPNVLAVTSVDQKRKICKEFGGVCKTNLCSGGDNIICCANQEDANQDFEDVGDPNLDVCCRICEKASKWDFSGCEYKSEAKFDWVKETTCNAVISSCTDSKDCDAIKVDASTKTVCDLLEGKFDCNAIYGDPDCDNE